MPKKKPKKKRKYVGKYPVNSRITIDYSSGKGKVKFGYPKKGPKDVRDQVIWSAPVMFPVLGILFIFLVIFSSDGISDRSRPEMDDCKVYFIHSENKTLLNRIQLNCYIDGEMYISTAKYYTGTDRGLFNLFKNPHLERTFLDYTPKEIRNTFLILLLNLALMFACIFLTVFLLFNFYTKTKLGQKWFPEISKKTTSSRYVAIFTKVPKSKTLELPLFKNVYLDYKASKDFGKQLERVEIKEHDFDELIKSKNRKERDKVKSKGQVFLWKATFYFKEIPKEGKLEIWWA